MAKRRVTPAYTTQLGRAFHGDAAEVLRHIADESIALVFTSPPFALRRQKAYGNVSADEYIQWFWPIVEQVRRILKPDGSFVMELGGAWNRGSGTRSLFPYELLIQLGKIFYLAQDFYWHNPSRLPTPAEWVTIRRTRVKEAVTHIWWLSKSTEPKADNRRVLVPYSKSMKRLLKDGYQPALRPSQHEIGPHFQRDNGGAIPPNVLTVPNTRSHDTYLFKCRAAGLPIHPARFPPELPDFFIRFLTHEGDHVLDPFAGSNVTGQVAQTLGRKWTSIEINADYVAGSRLRFDDDAKEAA
ncbi:MAG: site-specific DNA-methyltransferase [Planctomycetes bacterium]|nr:site-specific DNA-methyltransferase [Planctomycetota bacterium]